MEYLKKNRNSSLLFATFLALAIFGFSRTYFGLFPNFSPKITTITHLHGLSVTLWMVLLIVQPLLIWLKKPQLHLLIGKFSYFFVPFLALMMVLTIRQGYLRSVGTIPTEALLAFQFVPISAFTVFVVTYALAIFNRQSRHAHRSFMIINALGLLWAAFGRVHLGIGNFKDAVTTAYMIPNLMLLLLFFLSWFRGKPNRIYLLWFGIFMSITAFYYYDSEGSLWLSMAKLIFH